MYDLILQLPIFQGLSIEQLTGILEKIPFSFCRFAPGDMILSRNQKCEQVYFLLNGCVRQVTYAFCEKVEIKHYYEGPHTLSFHNLFGAKTTYDYELNAQTEVGMMCVCKSQFLNLLQSNSILLINMMNMLSSQAQRQYSVMSFNGFRNPLLKLAHCLLMLSDGQSVSVSLRAEESDWLEILGVDASDFYQSVTILQKKGCVKMENGLLKLTDRYDLKCYVEEKSTNI